MTNLPTATAPSEPLRRSARRILADSLRRLPALGLDLFLILLILVGVYFRFNWTDWSEGTNLAPDEYGLTNTLSQLAFPNSPDEYFNTRLSPISPYDKYDIDGNPTAPGPDNGMVWGQWPQIIIRGTAETLNSLQNAADPLLDSLRAARCAGTVQPPAEDSGCAPVASIDFTGYDQLRLLGRTLSALADTIILLTCLLIGLRLYSRRIALLGTALSALAVMQIQQSHFMTVDNFAAMFSVLAMYCVVRAAQKGGWRWYALFGCCYGMALASKINMAPLGVMIAVAVWISHRGRWQDASLPWRARLGPAAGQMALAVAITLLTFRVTQPMAFRAPTGDTTFFTVQLNPTWLERMDYAQRSSSGIGQGGYPPAEQWADRTPLLFPLINMGLWGMGLPLGLAGWGGLIWAAYQVCRGRDWEKHLPPVLFTGGMFLFLGTRWVMTDRYFLPLYPFLCLLAAWALAQLWTLASGRNRWLRGLAGAAVGVVVLGTLVWAWGFTSIYRNENTRVQATRWIYQNIPAPFNLKMQLPDGSRHQEPVPFYPDQSIGSEPTQLVFFPRKTGVLDEISLGFVRDSSGAGGFNLHVAVAAEADQDHILAAADLVIPPVGADSRGPSVSAALGPLELVENTRYVLIVSAAGGGPLTVQGAVLSNETWDEGLPQRMDERDGFGGLYLGIGEEMQWPDNEEKRQMLIDTLDQADFIILPSQRRLWSACRLPASYPMTMEYYRALFDGRLGFELAAQFQSPFVIGPLRISDLAATAAWDAQPALPVFNLNPLSAEEAFSVYDHAPVWIFRKRADFQLDRARAVLDAVDLTDVAPPDPGKSAGILSGLMLSSESEAQQQAGGTWSQMFSYDWLWNQYPGLAAAMWWLWAMLTGWAILPVMRRIFRGLPDEGYSLAKIAGWMLVTWAVWWLGSLQVPFAWTTIAAVWAGLLALGGFLAWRDRAQWKGALRSHGRTWLTMEIVFSAFFLFSLLLRLGYGDLWHLWTGGEKPMDFSYLNAVIKSTTFPPYDPWFSGGYLSYYYYGFVLVAVPIKLLGTVPSIGYNIAVPLLFGVLGVAAYGVVWNLAESLRRKGNTRISPVLAGLSAAILLAILGNLGEVRMVWEGLIAASALPVPHGLFFGLGDLLHAAGGAFRIATRQADFSYNISDWYWKATRAIELPPGSDGVSITDSGITEFPFFTFLLADLHAHLIAMPMILLSLGCSTAMVISPERLKRWQTALPLVGMTAFAVGALWPTNAWNYPGSLVIALLGLGLAGWRILQQSTGLLDWRGWLRIGILGGLLAGLSRWLYQPFYDWFGFGYSSLDWWKDTQTPWESYSVIHGLFLFILATYLVGQTRDWLVKTPVPDRKKMENFAVQAGTGICFLIAVLVVLAASGYTALALIVPLAVWAVLLGLRTGLEDEHRITHALLAIGLGLTGFVELVVLVGDIGRQNTVMKFYIQAWIFFSVAGGLALAWLMGEIHQWRNGLRRIWLIALGLLAAGAFFYTVEGSCSRIADRMSAEAPHTLDGLTFMQTTSYFFDDNNGGGTYDMLEIYDAIRWMQEKIQGSPVIVQSPWPHYRGATPYTMFTGLPMVIGWNFHERQQRGAVTDQWVWDRDAAVENFYRTTDLAQARDFLRKYGVRYVILGQHERYFYPGDGLEKFGVLEANGELQTVFSEGQTIIYEVVDSQP